MSIVAPNVNGIHSKLDLGILDQFIFDYDIVCLSETLTDDPLFIDTLLEEHVCIVKKRSDPKHKHGGVHGICVLAKPWIGNYIELISETTCDTALWVKVDITPLNLQFILCAVYFPCEGSRFADHDLFTCFTNDLLNLESRLNLTFCIAGDCNARTGCLLDYLAVDTFISDLTGFEDESGMKAFHGTALNCHRYNMDTVVNSNGKTLIQICQAGSLKLINGRIGSDLFHGDFTNLSANGASTIDYLLVSDTIIYNVCDFCIHPFDKVMSNTHRPISIQFRTNVIALQTVVENVRSHSMKTVSFRWKFESDELFIAKLDGTDFEAMSIMLDGIALNANVDTIDMFMKQLCDVFLTAAEEAGICLIRDESSGCVKKDRKPSKPWFDKECRCVVLNIKERDVDYTG